MITYSVSVPSGIGSTVSALVTAMSASAAVTAVVAWPLLLPLLDSVVAVVILTVLTILLPCAAGSGRTRTVTVYCVPGGMLGHSQARVWPAEPTAGTVGQLPPPEGVPALRKWVLGGITSVMRTVAAVDGPSLMAVST